MSDMTDMTPVTKTAAVKAMPDAAGLKTELLKIVKEAREVNLSRSSEKEKEKIEKQVKE